jgi:hypothetical protein
MQVWRRALGFLGFQRKEQPVAVEMGVYEALQKALWRIRLADLRLQEATTLEELDVARSERQSAWAEVQQIIRSAKRARGIAVRPIAETEELYRNMREHLNRGAEPERKVANRRRLGTR